VAPEYSTVVVEDLAMNPRFSPTYKEERLRVINEVLLPLLRIGSGRSKDFNYVKKLVEAYHRRTGFKIVDFDYTNDYCLARLEIDLTRFGAKYPVVYELYVSAQKSPIRPYQLEQKHSRLGKWSKKYSYPSDKFVVMVLPRLTLRLNEELSKKPIEIHGKKYIGYKGVVIVDKAEKLKNIIVRYFMRRLQLLINALRGKRIWGPVALLTIILSAIIKAFGAKPPEIDNNIELNLSEAVFEPRIVFH